MKIRNTGTNPITFNGGVAIPNRTVLVDDAIGEALIKNYSFIIKIEEAEKEVKAPESKNSDNLREKAKELGIKGYALMKEETLKEKIEEAEKESSSVVE